MNSDPSYLSIGSTGKALSASNAEVMALIHQGVLRAKQARVGGMLIRESDIERCRLFRQKGVEAPPLWEDGTVPEACVGMNGLQIEVHSEPETEEDRNTVEYAYQALSARVARLEYLHYHRGVLEVGLDVKKLVEDLRNYEASRSMQAADVQSACVRIMLLDVPSALQVCQGIPALRMDVRKFAHLLVAAAANITELAKSIPGSVIGTKLHESLMQQCEGASRNAAKIAQIMLLSEAVSEQSGSSKPFGVSSTDQRIFRELRKNYA